MRVHATLHGFAEKERELDLPAGAVADDAPRALGIRPELALVFRDQRPLPGDAPLQDGDRVRILRVVSGGARPPLDAKAALLGLSLAWLAGVGAFLLWPADEGGHIGWYFGGLAVLAGLGALGYARPSLRYPAAVLAAILLLVVAWISFSDVRILAGVVGVLASILLPPPEPSARRRAA